MGESVELDNFEAMTLEEKKKYIKSGHGRGSILDLLFMMILFIAGMYDPLYAIAGAIVGLATVFADINKNYKLANIEKM